MAGKAPARRHGIVDHFPPESIMTFQAEIRGQGKKLSRGPGEVHVMTYRAILLLNGRVLIGASEQDFVPVSLRGGTFRCEQKRRRYEDQRDGYP